MTDPVFLLAITIGTVHRLLLAPFDPGARAGHVDHVDRAHRDRGAISLEQVLWFVAAGVSVAVVAAILWSQIRDQANTPVVTPSAP